MQGQDKAQSQLKSNQGKWVTQNEMPNANGRKFQKTGDTKWLKQMQTKSHLGKWVTQIKNNYANGQKLQKMGDTKQLKCKRTNFQVLRSAIASSIALKK